MVKTIVIIGAGFSGTMTAVHLLKNIKKPVNIYLVDENEIGRGLAYKKIDDCLLLNVFADQMGAYPEAKDHFFKWLKQRNQDQDPKVFVSRSIYGDYLIDQLQSAIEEKNVKVNITLLNDNALEINRDTKVVYFKTHTPVTFDEIVLSVGVQKEKELNVENLEKYPLTILGTGLSMVDAVVRLDKNNFKSEIVAVSRHGYIPRPHKVFAETISRPNFIPPQPISLIQLLKLVKENLKLYEWRLVIDSIRPHSQKIWMELNDLDRSKFLRYLKPIWDIHRHRISENHYELLMKLQKEERLKIHKIGFNPYQAKTQNVLDCRGPYFKEDFFLTSLIENNIVSLDRFNLGVSSNFSWLKIIGPLRKGELWESTAVPELRIQAQELGATLSESLV